MLLIGFVLTVSIYVLVALLFGIYIPELFPTGIRMRGAGICNMFGRGATIVTPFIVVSAVMSLMVMLLTIQIIAVFLFSIEPANWRPDELKPDDDPNRRAIEADP